MGLCALDSGKFFGKSCVSESRWKSQFCKQNKLAKSANFVCKFKAKHAIKEQSQRLEESQNRFESKVADLDLLTWIFLLSSWEGVAVQVAVEKGLSFLTLTAFSSKISLLKVKLGVKINVEALQ